MTDVLPDRHRKILALALQLAEEEEHKRILTEVLHEDARRRRVVQAQLKAMN